MYSSKTGQKYITPIFGSVLKMSYLLIKRDETKILY